MLFIFFFLLLSACQNTDLKEAALKKQNQKGEYIYRTHEEITQIPPMVPLPVASYPWDKASGIPEITKEYFRCKGSTLNPMRSEMVRGEVVKYHDCGGAARHSLPLKEGKEHISPVFLKLLNHIQTKTQKRVVITSAYRCPAHNTYVDPSPLNQYSKHQIGAEVDFYVQGLENKPEQIVQIILDYYKTHPKKEFSEFKRYEKQDTNVTTQPWMNKELFIKLYKPKEGRNYDNRHPYPYISLQLRFDTETNQRITYSWDQAFRNFLRY